MAMIGLILYFGGFIVAAGLALHTGDEQPETEREKWKRS